jgi:hypothetical protein
MSILANRSISALPLPPIPNKPSERSDPFQQHGGFAMTPGKFDDVQIEGGALAPLGKEIAARSQKVHVYEVAAREKARVELQKAQDHRDAIAQRLAEAKAQCRGSGFKAFKAKYCTNIGRSRLYELLAIGSGNKSLEASRAATRERVTTASSGVRYRNVNLEIPSFLRCAS